MSDTRDKAKGSTPGAASSATSIDARGSAMALRVCSAMVDTSSHGQPSSSTTKVTNEPNG